MKMSYRDKCILVALIFIITVLVGGLTIIKSSVEKLQATTITHKQKKQEEADVKAKLATKGDLEKQIDDTYKELKKESEYFLPEMKTYQIDQYVSAFFAGSEEEGDEGLVIKSLSISEATAEDIEYYAYELFHVEYELGTATDLNEARLHAMKGNTEYAVTTSEPEQLVVSIASVGVKGDDFGKYLKVCDKIEDDNKSIVLRSLAKEGGSGGDKESEDTFTIYVYQLSDIQKPKY